MSKLVCGCMALSCTLLLAPLAPAMQHTKAEETKPLNKAVRSNVRADAKGGFVLPLDYDQLERVRIELLERGFNPGFDPARGNEIDPQLAEAISQFQMESSMPASGVIDGATLAALNLPIEKEGLAIEQSPQRAKPSK